MQILFMFVCLFYFFFLYYFSSYNNKLIKFHIKRILFIIIKKLSLYKKYFGILIYKMNNIDIFYVKNKGGGERM